MSERSQDQAKVRRLRQAGIGSVLIGALLTTAACSASTNQPSGPDLNCFTVHQDIDRDIKSINDADAARLDDMKVRVASKVITAYARLRSQGAVVDLTARQITDSSLRLDFDVPTKSLTGKRVVNTSDYRVTLDTALEKGKPSYVNSISISADTTDTHTGKITQVAEYKAGAITHVITAPGAITCGHNLLHVTNLEANDVPAHYQTDVDSGVYAPQPANADSGRSRLMAAGDVAAFETHLNTVLTGMRGLRPAGS